MPRLYPMKLRVAYLASLQGKVHDHVIRGNSPIKISIKITWNDFIFECIC